MTTLPALPAQMIEAAARVYVENTIPAFDHGDPCATWMQSNALCDCHVIGEARETTSQMLAAALGACEVEEHRSIPGGTRYTRLQITTPWTPAEPVDTEGAPA